MTELNILELEFLHLNEFRLNVTVEELQQYGDQLLLHWVREEDRRKELQWQRSMEAVAAVPLHSSSSSTNVATSHDTRDLDTGSRSFSTPASRPHVDRGTRSHHRTSITKDDVGKPRSYPRDCRHQRMHHAAPDITSSSPRLAKNYFQRSETREHFSPTTTNVESFVRSSKSHNHRHSWHIDQSHRLPTPPYHLVNTSKHRILGDPIAFLSGN